MKNWIGKHKKGIIILCIVGVIVVGIGYCSSQLAKQGEEFLAMMTKQETARVERRTLVESLSATGKVTSVESKSVTAEVSGVEVLNVEVEVGDVVAAGDLLCVFDTSDIEENLSNAQTTLNSTSGKTNINVTSAQRNLQEAQTNRTLAIQRADEDIADAWKAYEDAKEDLEDAEEEYRDKADAILEEQEAYANNAARLNALQQKLQEITTVSGADAAAGSEEQKQYNAVQSAMVANQQIITALERERDAIYNELYTDGMGLVDILESKKKAHEQMVENKDDTLRNQNSSVSTREDSLKSARLDATTAGQTTKQQIEQYEEQMEACRVTAPISGVITAVNVEKGHTYTGSSIVTIEDISAFEVTAEIDEYDIGKVKEGQTVVIKTNGTGDTQLDGRVTDIAPRATVGGTGVTYQVTMSIDTPNEYLKMDMTAKLSIILESKENILTVPYDAVQTDEEGNFYIEVTEENATPKEDGSMPTRRVYVSKGIESDYYVEVSGEEIEEGMTVMIPVSVEDNLMLMMGPMGGM